MTTLPISLLILSWKSPLTLHNTLSSYRDNGLLNLSDDIIIYFQEVSDVDLAIAEEFSITHVLGSSGNIGIGPAILELVKAAKHDVIMLLEEDWELIENFRKTRSVVSSGVELLQYYNVDFCRYRSNLTPGAPLYTTQFKSYPMASPEHLIEQVHSYGVKLADMYPSIFTVYNTSTADEEAFIVCDSFYGNYSNNPFLCTKQFYLDNVAVYDKGGISLEGEIRENWRKAGHRVAYNIPGLFTHNRIDR